MPFLNELNAIANEHNEIFSKYIVSDGKATRELKLQGGTDSLVNCLFEYNIVHEQSRRELVAFAIAINTLFNLAKDLASTESFNSKEQFAEMIALSLQLKEKYDEYLAGINLRSNAEPQKLDAELSYYVKIIQANWEKILKAIDMSGYSVNENDIKQVEAMLGLSNSENDEVDIEAEENPDEDTLIDLRDTYDAHAYSDLKIDGQEEENNNAGTEDKENFDNPLNMVDEDVEKYRALIDQLSDQLSVEIFPPGTTLDALKEDLESQVRNLKTEEELLQIEEERMQTLLELYQEYGGRLLRSSDNGKAILNSIYYVLVFESDGDVFALAENPLYRNATYITRKGITPLLKNESVVALFLNDRMSARSMGAKQLVHAPEAKTGKSHKERIVEAIENISNLKNI